MDRLNVYKTHPSVSLPTFLTKQAACFDIACQTYGKIEFKGYNNFNSAFTRGMKNGNIYIGPHERVLIPTGLILDIPEGYSVRIHPRSGISLKQGLTLANSEGVIDADYVDELYILMYNLSDNGHMINNGDRIAQGEMIQMQKYALWEIFERPGQKSEREGGMGSTGINVKII
jgi:dUTP pyrophosphatase